ncbi:O-antigen ligase family protein [Lysinibacillus sp. NPDC086135]|uniref:O-antigen ligase family protein n=1 Tax=Lysinibacillus sp. NPDC086135 TaxID=3364130 RepID=UPI00380F3718
MRFFILTMCMSVLLLSSALSYEIPILIYFTVFFSIFPIILFIYNRNENIRRMYVSDLFFYLFIICGLISTLANSDMGSLKNIVCMLMMYIGLSIIYNSFQTSTLHVLAISICVSHLIILLLSFFMNRVVFNAFAGIYSNPNMMGLVMALFAVVLLAGAVQFFQVDTKKVTIVFLVSLFFFVFYTILLTQSRTAAITVLIGIIMSITMLAIQNTSSIRIVGALVSVLCVLSMIFIFSLSKFPILNEAVQNIVGKFQRKSADISDGRMAIWQNIIKDSTLFGHGENYHVGQLDAHNTFIALLAQYGWLAVTFFLLFVATLVWNAFSFAKKKVKYAKMLQLLPFLILITYILLSMTEIIIYTTPIMIVLFVLSGNSFTHHKTHN